MAPIATAARMPKRPPGTRAGRGRSGSVDRSLRQARADIVQLRTKARELTETSDSRKYHGIHGPSKAATASTAFAWVGAPVCPSRYANVGETNRRRPISKITRLVAA